VITDNDHSNIRRIYHGTRNPDLKPTYGGGFNYHDYGNGLYCTEDLEAAKEWACQHMNSSTAYVYAYDLDMEGLHPVLNMNTLEPIYWLSALAQYRYGSHEPKRRHERRLDFIANFPIDCEQFEVIEGWRADDRYFAYLKYFLISEISYEAVVQAINLGDLGQQVVVKGKKAYAQCKQVGDRLTISGDEYAKYQSQYVETDKKADEQFEELRDIPGRLLSEIIAEGW